MVVAGAGRTCLPHPHTHQPPTSTTCTYTRPQAAIKAFYFLIFGAAALRSIWFFIPSDVLEPSYAPAEVWAFQTPVRAAARWRFCSNPLRIYNAHHAHLLASLNPKTNRTPHKTELGGHPHLGGAAGGRFPLPLRHLRAHHHLLGRPAQEGEEWADRCLCAEGGLLHLSIHESMPDMTHGTHESNDI